MTRPDFSVAADETPYRRLGAVIRDEVYRLVQSSYSFGVQSESGVVRLEVARSVLDGQRDRIYSKLEALLLLIDTMTEMKDVSVTRKDDRAPLRAERRKPATKMNHAAVAAAVETLKAKKEAWELDQATTGVPSQSAIKDADTAETITELDAPSPEQSSALESAANLAAHPYRPSDEPTLVEV